MKGGTFFIATAFAGMAGGFVGKSNGMAVCFALFCLVWCADGIAERLKK